MTAATITTILHDLGLHSGRTQEQLDYLWLDADTTAEVISTIQIIDAEAPNPQTGRSIILRTYIGYVEIRDGYLGPDLIRCTVHPRPDGIVLTPRQIHLAHLQMYGITVDHIAQVAA